MRLLALIPALLLVSPAAGFTQGWSDFESQRDGFSIVFPGDPAVREITWPSEYGAEFPGRVYEYVDGPSRYSVTVIDYRESERRHLERTNRTEADSGNPYWQIDIMGSIDYAATQFRQRDGVRVTYDAWHYIDLIEGHQLQLTNADESRTFAAIYLHENRLYIVEATVPRGAPQPGLFQQALSMLDENGERVRYDTFYSNRPPESTMEPRQRGGAGGGE